MNTSGLRGCPQPSRVGSGSGLESVRQGYYYVMSLEPLRFGLSSPRWPSPTTARLAPAFTLTVSRDDRGTRKRLAGSASTSKACEDLRQNRRR